MRNLFISYARDDSKDFAHELFDKQTSKIESLDRLRGGILPSTRRDTEIQQTIHDCDTLIFVMI